MELESGRVDCGDTGISFLRNELPVWSFRCYEAMLVEAVYAVLAGGLIGAISQQLRRAKPIWATALFICVVLPGLMTLAQVGIHRLAKTPHQSAGLVTSLCFAAFTSAYTWFAMRQGAMLGGCDATTVRNDLNALPRISWDFLLLAPRQLRAWFK